MKKESIGRYGLLRMAAATRIKEREEAKQPKPVVPLFTYHYTIMSTNPYSRSEDSHQKYGGSVEAADDKDAEMKAREDFSDEHGHLQIHWVKVSKGMPLQHMSM